MRPFDAIQIRAQMHSGLLLQLNQHLPVCWGTVIVCIQLCNIIFVFVTLSASAISASLAPVQGLVVGNVFPD
jgi:hypothetical protein